MQITKETFRKLINSFNFKELFIELGWDNYNDRQPQITIKDETYNIEAVSEKRGFVILKCLPNSNGRIPVYSIRKQIENKISKHHQEHLIIFGDAANNEQIWQLTIREEGKPTLTRETKYFSHQAPELIYQKLSGLFFSWDDEENISIVDVKHRVKENFNKNSEKVTKKFYQEFKKNHSAFLEFIEGITEKIDKDWYASLMLNRLMFIYFIQKKGFLDDNKNYLTDKLKQTKEFRGNDEFYSFYQDFLKILFHKGLGGKVRNDGITKEIGKIPYLNGGLFDVHELENKYTNIKIKDEAFEKLFAFFDEYEWHLDTRKESTGKEINPDVIGYIFEKYINDRAAMGAYYTKEDITEYIGKNTIIPFIFDEVKRHYAKGFKQDEYIWQMLSLSSDKYIYDAVKFGIPREKDIFADLPEEITKGFRPDIENNIVTEKKETHLFEIRKVWNKKAPADIALPTEIYRELIERRKRYADVKAKIENGEITQINDFITYNLNIRQFIQDIIAETDDPFLIKHFYDAIKKVTILDPTCGSGAFLFAALNILEPLYEGCINRMQQFTEENPNKYKKFEEILTDVNSPKHPNLQYFIYKSIILNNLFGVDIMNEAVEIAKLRLFLKLVSTADVDYKKDNYGLEPLPDIDFNIRCGNTLVGFTKLDEIKEYIKKKGEESIIFEDEHDKINAITDKAQIVAKMFSDFREQQTEQAVCDEGSKRFHQTKEELKHRLNELNEELNHYLAFIYGIDAEVNHKKFEDWKTSHQPFHWFSEFYEIMSSGGFDVIIGNPPYIVYYKKSITYNIYGFKTINCNNLYAFVVERAKILSINSNIGFIIPSSAFGTKNTESIRKLLLHEITSNFVSYLSGDAHPATLFEGVKLRLSILVSNSFSKGDTSSSLFTTKYLKWYSEERSYLFDYKVSYCNANDFIRSTFPKIQEEIDRNIIYKCLINKQKINDKYSQSISNNIVYYHNAPVFFIRSMDFIPLYESASSNEPSSNHFKRLYFRDNDDKVFSLSILNSSIFFYWFTNYSANRDLTSFDINNFPLVILDKTILKKISLINSELMDDLKNKSLIRVYNYKTGKVKYQEFYMRLSKHIIDEIDKILAQHYGFKEEELDFIINYDIKYRMGKELENYVNGEL